jgi:hypothetical protein
VGFWGVYFAIFGRGHRDGEGDAVELFREERFKRKRSPKSERKSHEGAAKWPLKGSLVVQS